MNPKLKQKLEEHIDYLFIGEKSLKNIKKVNGKNMGGYLTTSYESPEGHIAFYVQFHNEEVLVFEKGTDEARFR